MSVTITTGKSLTEKLTEGINFLGDTVSATLGSSGRPVAIRDSDGTIRITKDGYSVANAITSFKDPTSDMALQLGKAAAKKTVDEAGDGTTTTTLLVQSIYNEAIKVVNKDTNIVEVQRGIKASVNTVIEALQEQALEITTEDQIYQVAKLSANGDEEVAKLISIAIDKAGHDGTDSIEASKLNEDSLEEVEGMSFDRGLISKYFVTDESKGHSLLLNPYILIIDEVVNSAKTILQFLTYVTDKEKPLLIIAESVDSEAYATLSVNFLRGILKVAVVKSPDFGERKKAILQDIATLTGATVISKDRGYNLSKIKLEEVPGLLGECRSVVATANETTIVDGKGDKDKIEQRIEEIKSQIDNSKSPFEREQLQLRLGKLIGGVVILNIGGTSEVEMKEKKDRVEDALHATKAAISEGVVPGGGLALINCEKSLDELILPNRDQELGKAIIKQVLYSPFKKILINAGIDNFYEILTNIKQNRQLRFIMEQEESTNPDTSFTSDIKASTWQGYNVKTQEYGDVKTMGILDPVKVTRLAIENAASTAAMLIIMTADVSPNEDEKKDLPQY